MRLLFIVVLAVSMQYAAALLPSSPPLLSRSKARVASGEEKSFFPPEEARRPVKRFVGPPRPVRRSLNRTSRTATSVSFSKRRGFDPLSLFSAPSPRRAFVRSWEKKENPTALGMGLRSGLAVSFKKIRFIRAVLDYFRRKFQGKKLQEKQSEPENTLTLPSMDESGLIKSSGAANDTETTDESKIGSKQQANDTRAVIPEPEVTEPTATSEEEVEVERLPVRRMGGNTTNAKVVNEKAVDPEESIQERINRVKSGQLTEKEKAAFLMTSLSSINRQSVKAPTTQQSRVSAPPLINNSVLSNFASGDKKPLPPRLPDTSPKGSSEKKKREFLDMVTNPDRFKSYKTETKSKASSATSESSYDPRKKYLDMVTNPDRFESYKSVSSATPNSSNIPKTQTDGSTSVPPILQTNIIKSENSQPMPMDLGARLAAAAMIIENKGKPSSIKLDEDQVEKPRPDGTAGLDEDKEYLHRKAEETKKFPKDDKQVQKERLEQLMKAQDAYWEKKLAVERASKANPEQEKPAKQKVRHMTPQELVLQNKKAQQDRVEDSEQESVGKIELGDENAVEAVLKIEEESESEDEDAAEKVSQCDEWRFRLESSVVLILIIALFFK
jgi:hypothetical protein